MKKIFDLLIKGGHIIDGTGNPWYKADIGINQGKIKKIGFIKEDGQKTINAEGMVVSPGFIDLHNHADFSMFKFPNCENFIAQGITTGIMGNCGMSLAPTNSQSLELLKDYLSLFLAKVDYGWNWKTFKEYCEKVKEKKISINLAPLVGHGTIRIAVKGFEKSKASPRDMKEMKKLLAESMKDGAFGMSTGLIFSPGCYATTEELIELGKILRKYGGIYATHLRNEGSKLIESVEEAIRIGEENDIPVQISHHKASAGKENWGKINYSLILMEEARKRGVEVGCDVYPYIAGNGLITEILPIWTLEGGIGKMLERLNNNEARKKIKEEMNIWGRGIATRQGKLEFNRISIASCPPNREYEGKDLEEIIKAKNKINKPYKALFDFILEIKGDCNIISFSMHENDMKTIISHPLSSIVTDSWPTSPVAGRNIHPRAYGTFPKVLSKYVREEKLLTMEEAIRKMTSLPASIIRLKDRGLLKVGFWADIVIFDPVKIKDRATYQKPHQYPVGIESVIVNGGIAVENGKLSYNNFGKVLNAKE